MIISERKSIDEILGFLRERERVVITGCSLCASACKVGGENEILEIKKILEQNGKEVIGYKVFDPCCNYLKVRKDIKEIKNELSQADAVLSLSCGDGTQTIAKLLDVTVYPGTNTLFIGEIERAGQYQEACLACGDCQLGWTGGICPITKCAKSLINGPCGGSKDGKCEVDPENDCAWILIYRKLKQQDKLDNIRELKNYRNYQKMLHPKKVCLR